MMTMKIGSYVPFDGISFRIVRPDLTKPDRWVLKGYVCNTKKLGEVRIIKTTKEIEEALAEHEVDKIARYLARSGSTHGTRNRFGHAFVG